MDRHFVINYAKRWAWVIILVATAHVAFATLTSGEREPMIFPIAVFLGPIILSFDLMKGIGRTMILLPVPRRQLIQTLWWVAIGLPTVMILALSVIGQGLGFLLERSKHFQWDLVLGSTLVGFSVLSLMYVALTGLPANPKESANQNGRNVFFGALWGFSMGGSFFVFRFVYGNPDQVMIRIALMGVIGAFLATLAYQRTDAMLQTRASGRSANEPDPKPNKRSFFEFDSSRGGFTFMAQQTIYQSVVFTLMFIAFVTIYQLLFLSAMGSDGPFRSPEDFAKGVQGQLVILAIMPSFMMAVRLQGIRVFRSLPLSATQLTNRFLTLIFSCLAILSGIILAIMSALTDIETGLTTAKDLFMLGTLASLLVPIIVRFGFRPLTFMIIFPLFMMLTFSRIFWLQTVEFPYARMVITGIFLLASWISIKLLIQRSSHAYRQPPSPFFGAMAQAK